MTTLLSRLRALLLDRRYEIALGVAVCGYAILFSFMTILKYLALRSSAYDLGIYNQAMFTATRFGRLFYYTPDLPANPGGSVFGAHFVPVFFVILPIYALMPRPETLLVIQSFVLALAAIPLYVLGSRLSSHKSIGLLFAMLYLLSPLVEGINWLDFHPEAFVPLGFLTALYAMDARRWKLYFAGILLTLSSLEFTGVIVALYGAIELIKHRKSLVGFLKARRILEPGPVGLVTLVLAVSWTGTAVGFIHLFNPSQTFLFGGNFSWSILGARSLVGVPLAVVTDPQRAILALSYALQQKTLFLALVFLPFAVFLKWGGRIALPMVPWLFVSLTSNQASYFMFNDQYTAFLAPFLFAAAVYGYVRLRGSPRLNARALFKLKAGTITLALIVALIASPFLNISLAGYVVFGNRGVPTLGTHEQLASTIIGMIPQDASVLTQSNLFPLVSNRLNAFLFPYQTYFPPGTTFNSTVSAFMQKSDFVLLDVRTDTLAPTWMLKLLTSSPEFGLYAAADGIVLYKQGYHMAPTFFSPIETSWTARDLRLQSGTPVIDTSSRQQTVLFRSSSEGNTPFWVGPDTILPPGQFVLDFRIRIDSLGTDSVTVLQAIASPSRLEITRLNDSTGGYSLMFHEVHGAPIVLNHLTVQGADFSHQSYQDFLLPFNIDTNVYLGFSASQVSGQSGLYVDQITLSQLSQFHTVGT
jgi:uncharacterized membrane protein